MCVCLCVCVCTCMCVHTLFCVLYISIGGVCRLASQLALPKGSIAAITIVASNLPLTELNHSAHVAIVQHMCPANR